MSTIGHGYGSEWHLLRYLGYHRNTLSDIVALEVGCESVDWLDAPFSIGESALHRDGEWLGIDFLHSPAAVRQWKQYLPYPLIHWDAVAQAHFPGGRTEWLLVEAKAHAAELGETTACRAASPASIHRIRQTMALTQQAMDVAGVKPECWMLNFYQYCNRHAALHVLRRLIRPAVPARLVFIYFCGETHPGWNCPPTLAAWQPHLNRMAASTGIVAPHPLSPFVHSVFLDVAG